MALAAKRCQGELAVQTVVLGNQSFVVLGVECLPGAARVQAALLGIHGVILGVECLVALLVQKPAASNLYIRLEKEGFRLA